MKVQSITKGQIKLNKGIISYIESGASISIRKGPLDINKKWGRLDPGLTTISMSPNSQIAVNGRFEIYAGSSIVLGPDAKLTLGGGYINNDAKIYCNHRVSIGRNVMLGERLTIRDHDGHFILPRKDDDTSIKIGNNVWIGANVQLLKGARIGSGSVIAAGSIVNGVIPENSLAGGIPAKIIRQEIKWE